MGRPREGSQERKWVRRTPDFGLGLMTHHWLPPTCRPRDEELRLAGRVLRALRGWGGSGLARREERHVPSAWSSSTRDLTPSIPLYVLIT